MKSPCHLLFFSAILLLVGPINRGCCPLPDSAPLPGGPVGHRGDSSGSKVGKSPPVLISEKRLWLCQALEDLLGTHPSLVNPKEQALSLGGLRSEMNPIISLTASLPSGESSLAPLRRQLLVLTSAFYRLLNTMPTAAQGLIVHRPLSHTGSCHPKAVRCLKTNDLQVCW